MSREFAAKGIIPAIVTPCNSRGEVSEGALRGVVRHVLRGGVHGVFAVGTTGEYFRLSFRVKVRVTEVVMEEVNGAVPVYMGASAESTRESVELAREAQRLGVDAVTVLTPRSAKLSEAELYEHYRAIAAAADLPVILYGNPGFTGVGLSVPLVRKLSEIENIVGIKDSSGDIELTREYIQGRKPGFCVLSGNDTLILMTLVAGGDGAVAATANVVPELVSGIYEDFKAGRVDGAKEKQARLSLLRGAFGMGSAPSVMIKEAMRMIGIDAGVPIAPALELGSEQKERLKAILREVGAVR